MNILITSVHVVVCFVLILVILLQAGRGSGLSWGSLGGTPQSFFGTKSASFLAKATSVCAILFLFTCIGLNILEARKSRSLFKNSPQAQIDIEKIKKALAETKNELPTDSQSSNVPTQTPPLDIKTETLPASPDTHSAAAQ